MPTFDKAKQIASMQTAVNKLVAHFDKKGVKFQTQDEDADNVLFIKGTKVVKISHHSFYRYSGIASITRTKADKPNESESIKVTDEMYMQMFMLPIIETLLEK